MNRITDNSISTKIRPQDQQEQQYNPEGDNYYNNYNPARARARELPPAEVMQQISQAYHDNISRQITKVAAGVIERALLAGMEPATVILAIEETGMASRPSPYYLSAVLRNWAETGVVSSRRNGSMEVSTTEAKPWWR